MTKDTRGPVLVLLDGAVRVIVEPSAIERQAYWRSPAMLDPQRRHEIHAWMVQVCQAPTDGDQDFLRVQRIAPW